MFNIQNLKGRERLLKEYDLLTNDPDINNCFGIDYWDPDAPEPDVFHWQITLVPPIGTDYEGGFYKIEARFFEDYPTSAPQLKFVTRIYHCNVAENSGHICVNSIKDSWKPSLTMEDVLNHIMILLYKQNPGSPMNGTAADLYREDKKKFLEKVKEYKDKYANINDFENLAIQNISTFKECKCSNCNDIYKYNSKTNKSSNSNNKLDLFLRLSSETPEN